MKPEKVKEELNKQYSGQVLRPSLIIDIIVDAIELMKQEDTFKLIPGGDRLETDQKLDDYKVYLMGMDGEIKVLENG